MQTRSMPRVVFVGFAFTALLAISACVSNGSGSGNGPGTGATGGTSGGGAGEIPIVAAVSADVPYQFGTNTYGVAGGAFLAKAPMGSSTVVLDTTQAGKICLSGMVDTVPVPPDGSHPPYSTYWGFELGFNLNQGADGTKSPWLLPAGVIGLWFTVEGSAVPPIRFKATPTGKDPAQEQDSCAVVNPISGARTEIRFANMYVQCWDGPQGTGPTDTSVGLVDMGLQVAADTSLAYPIEFCLTHVGVLLQ